MENLASVIWDELKRYINTVDRGDAAENLLSVLIDNDCDPEQIKSAFAGDADIKRALADYINNDEEEYEDYGDDADEEDADWEN
jgi:hypothetical protein